jgi:hypothetical protein
MDDDKYRRETMESKIQKPAAKPPRIKAFVGVLLLVFGMATYFFNYERQTLETSTITTIETILEYYAPLWDPLPHHVMISAETSSPVMFRVTLTGETAKTETFLLGAGETVIDVYPGETVSIEVENPAAVEGKIKTVLWCDSWNYAAGIFMVVGGLLLLLVGKEIITS